MVKCPFCQFNNEDGALFCEQCKSDLGTVAPAGGNAGGPPPLPGAPVPMAAILEDTIPLAPVVEPAPAATPVAQAEPPRREPAAEPALPPMSLEPAPPPMPYMDAAPMDAAPAATPATPAATPAPAAAPTGNKLPPGAQPRLHVLRGRKPNVDYPIYADLNFIGRADEKPVDIDLEEQEDPNRIWCSRQHAIITFENGELTLEDLNSANGTYVNRTRVYPGQKRPLNVNDVIQIGTVQLKVLV
jgi:FHA domain